MIIYVFDCVTLFLIGYAIFVLDDKGLQSFRPGLLYVSCRTVRHKSVRDITPHVAFMRNILPPSRCKTNLGWISANNIKFMV